LAEEFYDFDSLIDLRYVLGDRRCLHDTIVKYENMGIVSNLYCYFREQKLYSEIVHMDWYKYWNQFYETAVATKDKEIIALLALKVAYKMDNSDEEEEKEEMQHDDSTGGDITRVGQLLNEASSLFIHVARTASKPVSETAAAAPAHDIEVQYSLAKLAAFAQLSTANDSDMVDSDVNNTMKSNFMHADDKLLYISASKKLQALDEEYKVSARVKDSTLNLTSIDVASLISNCNRIAIELSLQACQIYKQNSQADNTWLLIREEDAYNALRLAVQVFARYVNESGDSENEPMKFRRAIVLAAWKSSMRVQQAWPNVHSDNITEKENTRRRLAQDSCLFKLLLECYATELFKSSKFGYIAPKLIDELKQLETSEVNKNIIVTIYQTFNSSLQHEAMQE